MSSENKTSSGMKLTTNDICRMLIADCKPTYGYATRSVPDRRRNAPKGRQRHYFDREEEYIRESEDREHEELMRREYEERIDAIHEKYGYHSDIYNDGNTNPDEIERQARHDDYLNWW